MANEVYNIPASPDNSSLLVGGMGGRITIHDIMAPSSEYYMHLILISSALLFVYVLYTNYVLGTRYDLLTKYNIDVHELAILPVTMLLGITLAYEGYLN